MAASLDATVQAFIERPLEMRYPYLWLDALYVKVREGGRTVGKAVLIATAVSETGEREILGVDVASGEMESCWRRFLESLVARGLTGVQLAISDAHTGLRKAITGVLVGSTWQRCTVHFLRNVLALLPKTAQALAAAAFRTALMQPTVEATRSRPPSRLSAEARAAQLLALLHAEPDALTRHQIEHTLSWSRSTTRAVLASMVADGRVALEATSKRSPHQRYRVA